MKIVNADIFTCEEDVIVHQTNCQGVMGSGVAKQLKQLYPEVFRAYYHYCKTNVPSEILGTSLICEANDGKYIANLFGQLNFGSGLQTDYEAFRKAFKEITEFASENNLTLALPFKIGCGFAGGDWNTVLNIIIEEKTVPVTLYKI